MSLATGFAAAVSCGLTFAPKAKTGAYRLRCKLAESVWVSSHFLLWNHWEWVAASGFYSIDGNYVHSVKPQNDLGPCTVFSSHLTLVGSSKSGGHPVAPAIGTAKAGTHYWFCNLLRDRVKV